MFECWIIFTETALEAGDFIYGNNWAIHTILYRVCCSEYSWLFVNALFYAVLCIPHSKCIFLTFNQQHYFRKTYENIYTFCSFTQFDSMKLIQLLKNVKKRV